MYDFKALYEAGSLAHAIELRQAHPEALIIAGGSDQLIKLREGKLAGCSLISIFGLDELRGVSMAADGTLRVGALTSFSHITKDPLVQKHIPVLGEAVDQVGGPQIRNIGTIGGNVCNGVTSADSGSTVLAWDAVMELQGPEGVRLVSVHDWYLGPGKADVRPGEILTALLFSREAYEGWFGHYIKYPARKAMDIATLGCSLNLKLSADKKTVEDIRLAYGVAGPVPLRARTAEAAVKGCPLSAGTMELLVQTVQEDIRPRDSWRSTAEFRQHIARETARRCFREAVKRAGGELA